ncbi:MAG: gamma-glutamyl-gamma-aminobutyrate hydrolase family protein [Candidatus Nomurabacteria bacterium]|nr:gamma-glutamyl-gamma-aminobutyrate hydrolase family protein [Candidatus Nomurabacteria bacterium]
MPNQPIIGIVAKPNFIAARHGAPQFGIVDDWRRAIVRAGGIPIGILPTEFGDEEQKNLEDSNADYHISNKALGGGLLKQIQLCPGIVLMGGLTFHSYEVDVARFCLENNIPVIGSCAGFNVLVTAAGGKVRQGTRAEKRLHDRSRRELYAHDITIMPSTKLYEIFGTERAKVNSRHWMMADVANIPKTLKISAESDDGLIEAVELPSHKFAIGVKWHPESMTGYDAGAKELIEQFVKASIENDLAKPTNL